jgi:TolA-binding protein
MKKPALLALLLLVFQVLGAREALPQSAAAPFVSRLRAAAGQSSVQLSWRTVPGFAGSYRIYRHTREIDEASFPAAVQIGTVGPEVGTYEDFPPAPGSYYYAVLMDDGKLSPLFVPFRNKTSTAVEVAGAAPERDRAARITGLSAEPIGDAVRLHFQSSRSDRELLLFRSLQPMRSGADLNSSPFPLKAGTTRYDDYPIPGLDYYYALVDAGLFKIGQAELAAGVNTTLQPVRVPLESGRVGLPPAVLEEVPPPQAPSAAAQPPAGRQSAVPARGQPAAPAARRSGPAVAAPASAPASEQILMSVRPAPLPYLDLDAARGVPSPALPAPRPLGPVARRAVEAVLREAPPPAVPKLRAQALPEDLGADHGPEDSGLGALVSERLLTGDLPAAEQGLLSFLAMPRTDEVAARARFYLGQVYYLRGKLEAAVLELLLARPQYYSAVQPWLDNCLMSLSLADR